MKKRIIPSLLAIIILLLLPPHVWGQAPEAETARILRIEGTAMVYQHHNKRWSVAKKGMGLFQADVVKTLSDSELDLLIENVAVVRLKQKTTLEIAEIQRETTKPVASSSVLLVDDGPSGIRHKTFLKLLEGKLLLWVKYILQGSIFDVETPIGIAGVRGTRFMVCVPNQDTMIVAVLEGLVEVKNIRMPDKTVLVRKLGRSIILRGAYPSEPRRVSAEEHGDLKETLELKFLREAKRFMRKPGSRYDGMYSNKDVYWEDSGGMVDHGTISGGSMLDSMDTMGGTSTQSPGDMQSGGGKSKPSKDGHR